MNALTVSTPDHAAQFAAATAKFTSLPVVTSTDCASLQSAAGKLSYREQRQIDGALYAALRTGALSGVDYVKAKDSLTVSVDERSAAIRKFCSRVGLAQLGGLVAFVGAAALGYEAVAGVSAVVTLFGGNIAETRFSNRYGTRD